MYKYYSVLSLDYDNSDMCEVLCIIKIKKNINIYEYLAQIYIDYKNTGDSVGDSVGFYEFCKYMDDLLSYQDSHEYSLNYMKRWIQYDSQNSESSERIIIKQHELLG